MDKLTLSELKEVEAFLNSLLPPDKKDWKPSQRIFSEDLNFVVSQLELFLKGKKFKLNDEKLNGASLHIYSTLLDIDRGELSSLSLEEKTRITDLLRRAKDFLQHLRNALKEKRRQ